MRLRGQPNSFAKRVRHEEHNTENINIVLAYPYHPLLPWQYLKFSKFADTSRAGGTGAKNIVTASLRLRHEIQGSLFVCMVLDRNKLQCDISIVILNTEISDSEHIDGANNRV